MDLKVWISVFSVAYSWIFCAVLSAPAAETTSAAAVSPQRHVRNKRCSCATFLDKECVYFCHLDIIWVNTPERVVSYGLGYAPRARRALSDSRTGSGPRCRCLRQNDRSCTNFCLRLEPAADALIRSSDRRAQEGDTGVTERKEAINSKQVSAGALRAALRTRTLLEKWISRRRHRTRTRQGESTPS